MEYVIWVAVFAAGSLVWAWVIFWGGDEWLEGSFLAALFVYIRAPAWTADGLRLFAQASWFVQTVWFVAGLFSREVRRFWL